MLAVQHRLNLHTTFKHARKTYWTWKVLNAKQQTRDQKPRRVKMPFATIEANAKWGHMNFKWILSIPSGFHITIKIKDYNQVHSDPMLVT